MKKGWFTGLASRFSNHYYVKLKQDNIQSRCGQISLRMLNGRGLDTLKLMKSKYKLCGSCQHLIDQDSEQKMLLEPFRY